MIHDENLQKRLLGIWSAHFKPTQQTNVQEGFVHQIKILNQINASQIITIVFSFVDLSILYANDAAAKYFGTSSGELLQEGSGLVLSCFEEQQRNFAFSTTQFTAAYVAQSNPADILQSSSNFVNWTVVNKKGIKHSSLFSYFTVQLDEHGFPLIGMYFIYNVAPYIKKEHWWYRFNVGNTIFHYHSATNKLAERELISPRELDVLQLMAKQKSNKQIAAFLNISVHTVENHRRNMLKSTGALDASGLIHICTLTGILST